MGAQRIRAADQVARRRHAGAERILDGLDFDTYGWFVGVHIRLGTEGHRILRNTDFGKLSGVAEVIASAGGRMVVVGASPPMRIRFRTRGCSTRERLASIRGSCVHCTCTYGPGHCSSLGT